MSDDNKELFHVCPCEDDTVSVIVPNHNSKLSEEEWSELHHIDKIEDLRSFHPLQFPCDRKNRNSWKVEDNTVIV